MVDEQDGFAFHTKCKWIKFNHRCFVDDVLLFCKGEFQAVLLMLRVLNVFSITSELTTNAGKFNIFSAIMESPSLEDLCELAGFHKGALPFRYLDVPISSNKLSIVECEIMVDKITTRIRSWGSRNLSYAGCAQLKTQFSCICIHIGHPFS